MGNNSDCNDSDPDINPLATEICDDVDNDCNNQVDDGLPTFDYWFDSDMDGYGIGTPINDCESPGPNYATQNGDCSPSNPAINPGATELWNGIDDNCNSQVDEGFPACQITDISMANTQPCDHQNTCSPADDRFTTDIVVHYINKPPTGELYLLDYFGAGIFLSVPLSGIGPNSHTFPNITLDANGQDLLFGAVIAPYACELINSAGTAPPPCSDPQGVWYADSDSDGYGNSAVVNTDCLQPTGFVADSTDCDDSEPTVYPNALELCNGIDNNCDGNPESETNTWNGNGDGLHWNDADNWSDELIPLPCQEVIIPTAFTVTLQADSTAVGKTLDVALGSQLKIDSSGVLIIEN